MTDRPDYFARLAYAIDPEAFESGDHVGQRRANERLQEALSELSHHYDVVPRFNPVGGVPLLTPDYGADGLKLRLSRTSLGDFMVALIKHGGNVKGVFSMSRDLRGAYVQMSITVPEKNVAALEAETGLRLDKPPRLKLA